MAQTMTRSQYGLPMSRAEQLGLSFPAAVDAIEQQAPERVDEGALADYLALGWLEKSASGVRLTLIGACVCGEMRRLWMGSPPPA
jgi:hypothetical protein